MRLIAKATADNTANINWALPPGFDRFRIVGTNYRPATDGAYLWARVSTDGGSNYATSGYASVGFVALHNYHIHQNWGTASFCVTATLGNGAAEGGDVDAYLTGAAAGMIPRLYGEGIGIATDAVLHAAVYSGHYVTNTDRITHLRLLCSTGNIAAGTFFLYGE